MHKKVIKGKVYYYTSLREGAKIKTVYLGSSRRDAQKKENDLKGLTTPNYVLQFALIFLVVAGLSVLIFGIPISSWMICILVDLRLV